MTRAAGVESNVSLSGYTLLAIPLLVGGLCVFLNMACLRLQTPALAFLAFTGSFLAAMATLAGFRILQML